LVTRRKGHCSEGYRTSCAARACNIGDRKYDYRYSVLTDVFARLFREGRVSEEELKGLGEEKLAYIRSFAKS
jgi:hypothetical protein